MKDDFVYWVWFSSLDSVAPLKKYKLVELFGNPYEIWRLNKDTLEKILGKTSEKITAQIIDINNKKRAYLLAEQIIIKGINICTVYDKNFPEMLKNMSDPPIVLYYYGCINDIQPAIGIVGSRKATAYGKNLCCRMSSYLAAKGLTIVSGLANGIDTFAHKGALSVKGKTIAVLGNGPDIVYPKENIELYDKIKKDGCVVSEYPPGTKPTRYSFPQRNRIISGLSQSVVIVEAGVKSGALITADFALEQGKEVYAVPGNIDSPCSAGTNSLIRQGAKIVTCFDDIIEDFADLIKMNMPKYDSKILPVLSDILYQNDLTRDEKNIIKHISDGIEHIDMIAQKVKLPLNRLNILLTMLELKGIVEQYPGKIFKLRV